MRTLLLFLLVGSASAQTGSLVGTVLGETGEPLSGATVYLSGTTRGDATDDAGRYEILSVPPGAYRLVGSLVGYEPVVQEVDLEDGDTVTTDFTLYTARRTVGFVRVEAPRDTRWTGQNVRFVRAFLGESARGDSARIVNPEVLEFQERAGVLQAAAAKPLLIENRALGYLLTYDLRAFVQTADEVRYDGDARFEPLDPGSDLEAERWARARADAYRGSLAHLLRTLVEDDLEDSGFTLTLDEDRATGTMGTMGQGDAARVVRRRDVFRHDRDGGGVLRFRGELGVRYDEPEDPAFARSALVRGESRPTANAQQSLIELRAPEVRLDERGTPEAPLDVLTRGYMGFERLADLVPDDYAPDR
ncbi:carboxypeptidase-like regulatory domain-containing protein [Rubrivirga sp.]|uniref:carboxypeptidase-like regulatory domain-containing protein n=1 Tax=Rubrivirga sp. TaxID=1885344 RepID=UPI003C754E99